jgi:L-serine dehydratase
MEAVSVFDIFKIGVGPSSSHTMGPWRASQAFVHMCQQRGIFARIERVTVELFGSLAKTGKGHGTDFAVLMGLEGADPETCDTSRLASHVTEIRGAGKLNLGGTRLISFDVARDLIFTPQIALPFHPNGMTITAFLDDGTTLSETYYSIGGGFILREGDELQSDDTNLPFPIENAADLVRHCREQNLTIPEIVWRNELTWRDETTIKNGLHRLWQMMQDSIYRGCHTFGTLPGPIGVIRRAARINEHLLEGRTFASVEDWLHAVRTETGDFQNILKWVTCFALAVNEENASFGCVVTAPTNGAAGVIPAVLMHALCFCSADERAVEVFLLTAGEIGSIFKKGATLSAAMGGCQAEIGVASAMAAGALCQISGGTPEGVLMAAEIAMEHHLGLTCDPIGGLVQIPCIERNTMGAMKAITSCHLALESEPSQAKVPLDTVIQTMWATAQDMNAKYKETSEGGLALQIPVSLSEC